MSSGLPLLEECQHPSQFYRLMELQRETLPNNMLEKDYIPIFIVNLLRDKLSPDSPSNSPLIRDSSSSGSSGFIKRARLQLGRTQSDWTQITLLENNADFEGMYFMEDGTREFVHRVLYYTVELQGMKGIGLNAKEFTRLFCQEVEFPCLELLWLLDSQFKVLSLPKYLMKVKSKVQVEYFVNQFLSFCFSPCLLEEKTRGQSTRMLQEFLRSLIVCGYCNPEDSESLIQLQKLAVSILSRIRERLMGMSIESPSYQNLHLLIATFSTVSIVGSLKRKYFTAELRSILMKPPELSIRDVLQQQERILEVGVGNSSISDTIALYLSEPQRKKGIIELMVDCLKTPLSLNWEYFLATVTVWEEREYESKRVMLLLKSLIQTIVLDSLKDENEEALLSGFVLARHASLLSPQKFNRYQEWWSSQFENELTTCAGQVKQFLFLLQTLTGLVAIEPPTFLQVHATYPPFIPVGCDKVWKDYLSLVKGRISEYREIENAMDYQPTTDNPILYEVEMAIKAFDKVNRIPNGVIQLYMFKKEYYVETFLPLLLTKPITAALSDGRLRLIEALNIANKIPPRLYMDYKSQNQNQRV